MAAELYVRKAAVVRAVRYRPGPGGNCREVAALEASDFDSDTHVCNQGDTWVIAGDYGLTELDAGDWLVWEGEGRIVGVKASDFDAEYEPVPHLAEGPDGRTPLRQFLDRAYSETRSAMNEVPDVSEAYGLLVHVCREIVAAADRGDRLEALVGPSRVFTPSDEEPHLRIVPTESTNPDHPGYCGGCGADWPCPSVLVGRAIRDLDHDDCAVPHND